MLPGLSGCNNRPAPAASATIAASYFNLTGFVQEQVQQLTAMHPTVEKTVMFASGTPETKVISNINWNQELETFTQADINKPALRAAYAVTTATTPNGQTQTTYRRRPGNHDSPVEYLQVTTTPNQQVTQITGRQSDTNYFVDSFKEFTLTCVPANGQTRLRNYSVSGTQKTIFFPELRYRVQGQVQ
jgi:hypothetical protein